MGLAKSVLPIYEEETILLPQPIAKEEENKFALVAVYGNDKMGLCRHSHLGKFPKFLGRGTTKKKYSMQGIGLPFVFKSPQKAIIIVEVYEIPLRILESSMDNLHGSYFSTTRKGPFICSREEVDITLMDGSKCKAWMYITDNRWKKEEIALPNTPGGYEWLGIPILP